MATLASLEIPVASSDSASAQQRTGFLNFTFTTTQRTSSFFKQDLKRLGRIIIVTLMATITLLVVTVLLYEAVVADDKIIRYDDNIAQESEQQIDRVLVGPKPAAARLNGSSSFDVNDVVMTTDMPPLLPPALPRQHYRDMDYQTYRKNGRRKNAYRNKKPKPFKVRLTNKDVGDPYMYGDEYDDHHHAASNNYHSSTNPKSIQEIVRYLTDPRPNNMLQNGLKFSGSFRNPTEVQHPEYKHNNPIGSASNNPLEDIRLSGDPLEINSGLMGLSTSRSKPIPVSLMLDIYPMHENTPPKRKIKRKPTSYTHFSSNYNTESDEQYFNRPASSVETFHSTGQYYRPNVHNPYADSSEYPYQNPQSNLYHQSPTSHRDHYARPSQPHQVRRPFHGASHDDVPTKQQGHQIMLHLNFHPKKRTRGTQLYDRAHNNQYPSPRYRLNDKYDSPMKGHHPRVAYSTSTIETDNRDETDKSVGVTTASNVVTESTSNSNEEIHNHRNHASNAAPLLSHNNIPSHYSSIVGTHGYTYELPPQLFFDENDPEPRTG